MPNELTALENRKLKVREILYEESKDEESAEYSAGSSMPAGRSVNWGRNE